MWTRAHREIYRQSGVGLPSQLYRTGNGRGLSRSSPGETRRSAARDGYAGGDERDLLPSWTGCPWRYLPRGDFPRARRSTTYSGSSRAAESRGTTGTTIVCWHRRRLRGPECLNGVQIAIVHGAVHPSQEARCRPDADRRERCNDWSASFRSLPRVDRLMKTLRPASCANARRMHLSHGRSRHRSLRGSSASQLHPRPERRR